MGNIFKFLWSLIHVTYSHSSSINMLADGDVLLWSGARDLLSQCFEEAAADSRPFDPHYFRVQTMDFNYQITPSATASSSAYVPRTAKDVRLISGKTAACLCHFGSSRPITVEGILMMRYLRLFYSVFKGRHCHCCRSV